MCVSPATAACRSCAERPKLLLLAYQSHCCSCLRGRRPLRCSLHHFSLSVRLQEHRHVHISRFSHQANVAYKTDVNESLCLQCGIRGGIRCCDNLMQDTEAARVKHVHTEQGSGSVKMHLLSDGLLCLRSSGLLGCCSLHSTQGFLCKRHSHGKLSLPCGIFRNMPASACVLPPEHSLQRP